jgi:hypothetical protein
MRNDLAHERYIVEVDGIAKAEYPIFVCALKASLQLKQELPNCRVKLRDAVTIMPIALAAEAGGTSHKPLRSAPSRQTNSVSMTWLAMSGSG